jgi:hypothetical protein
MPTWKVDVEFTCEGTVIIEAETEDDAREAVESDGQIVDYSNDTVGIECSNEGTQSTECSSGFGEVVVQAVTKEKE